MPSDFGPTLPLSRRYIRFRAAADTKLHSQKEYDGTGVGLVIVKRIGERNGGRVWVQSDPGRGSVFNFTIADEIAVSVNCAAGLEVVGS